MVFKHSNRRRASPVKVDIGTENVCGKTCHFGLKG